MEPILVGRSHRRINELSSDGFRVLAVANKKVEKRAAYSKADEDDLVLTGYLAFLDPPKETAAKAIAALQPARRHGESAHRRQRSCHAQGLHARSVSRPKKSCSAVQVEKMTDDELAESVRPGNVFARLSPAHKQRIVKALQKQGPRRRLHGRRHQRRAGPARGRRRHLGGQRGRYRQGIGGRHSAGERI